MARKKKKIDLNNIKPEESMKCEIGKIGGLMTKRRNQAKREALEKNEKEDVNGI